LDCQLDLKEIAQRARNAEYNPKVKYIYHDQTICPVSCCSDSCNFVQHQHTLYMLSSANYLL
jgi:hypothetical protein